MLDIPRIGNVFGWVTGNKDQVGYETFLQGAVFVFVLKNFRTVVGAHLDYIQRSNSSHYEEFHLPVHGLPGPERRIRRGVSATRNQDPFFMCSSDVLGEIGSELGKVTEIVLLIVGVRTVLEVLAHIRVAIIKIANNFLAPNIHEQWVVESLFRALLVRDA